MVEEVQQISRKRERREKERTCIACLRRDVPGSFLRLVSDKDGNVVVDWRRNLQGRGANVCPSRRCVETALNKRLLGRVLKREVCYPTAEDLITNLKYGLDRRLETLIRSSQGARKMTFGAALVRKEIASGKASCVLVARDSAVMDKVLLLADRQRLPALLISTKQHLGELSGRRPTGVAAITDSGLARALVSISSRLEGLA